MQDRIPDVLHPARGDALTPLERELWRFRMVALEVHTMLQGFHSLKDAAKLPDGLMFSLVNYGLILVSKFLEVWNDFGSLARFEPRVIQARRVTQPLVDRVLVWPGLEDFRNTILAHPFTTKDGRLVGPWFLLQSHRAPTYHAEAILLLNCVNVACAGVLSVFFQEYRDLRGALSTSGADPEAGPGISLGADIAPETSRLAMEVHERLRREGLTLDSPVFEEFKKATHPPAPPTEAA